MEPTHYQKIKSIVANALDLPEAKQKSYVKKECGDDQEAFNEVIELLNLDLNDSFLAKKPFDIDIDLSIKNQPLKGLSLIHI